MTGAAMSTSARTVTATAAAAEEEKATRPARVDADHPLVLQARSYAKKTTTMSIDEALEAAFTL